MYVSFRSRKNWQENYFSVLLYHVLVKYFINVIAAVLKHQIKKNLYELLQGIFCSFILTQLSNKIYFQTIFDGPFVKAYYMKNKDYFLIGLRM